MVKPRIIELKNPYSYRKFYIVGFSPRVYFTTESLSCVYCGDEPRHVTYNDKGVIYCSKKMCKELVPPDGEEYEIRILDDTIKLN